jgi:hypothetical protein
MILSPYILSMKKDTISEIFIWTAIGLIFLTMIFIDEILKLIK